MGIKFHVFKLSGGFLFAGLKFCNFSTVAKNAKLSTIKVLEMFHFCRRKQFQIADFHLHYSTYDVVVVRARLTGRICDWIFGFVPKNSCVIALVHHKTQSTVRPTCLRPYLRTRTRKTLNSSFKQ